MEQEQDNRINFLAISVKRTANSLVYTVYQKATHTIIHDTSCHPIKHKMSAINYVIHTHTHYEKELNKHRNEHNKTQCTTEPVPNKQPLKTNIKKM
jgi:hypothetical protein